MELTMIGENLIPDNLNDSSSPRDENEAVCQTSDSAYQPGSIESIETPIGEKGYNVSLGLLGEQGIRNPEEL